MLKMNCCYRNGVLQRSVLCWEVVVPFLEGYLSEVPLYRGSALFTFTMAMARQMPIAQFILPLKMAAIAMVLPWHDVICTISITVSSFIRYRISGFSGDGSAWACISDCLQDGNDFENHHDWCYLPESAVTESGHCGANLHRSHHQSGFQ